MSAIIAKSISKSFNTGKVTIDVIKALDIDIHPGELTLIVGPSGSGKSTLLAMLSGLLQPDAGQVFTAGNDLWAHRARQIDRFRLEHCGFIFQGFNLFPALTAFEQVLLPLRYFGASGPAAEAQAREALALVGLESRAHLRPLELSGGEQQRTAIARAIVKQPDLLFADEPTSSLDRQNGQVVIDILHRIARERGSTVLCVSHDPRLVEHADRIVHLEDGCIVADRRPERIHHEVRQVESHASHKSKVLHPGGGEAMNQSSYLFRASTIVGLLLVALVLGWCTNNIGAHPEGADTEVLHDQVPASRYVAIAKGQVDLEDGIIRLAASREGLIHEVLVSEGDFVKRGQVLLVIDDQQARLQLKQAVGELEERRAALGPLRARLAVAEEEVARLAPLARAESVPRQDLDKAEGEVAVLRSEIVAAQAGVDSAHIRVTLAAYDVEQRVVRAPSDGQIIRKHAKAGDGISTMNVTSLFLFAPASPRIVRADLEERFVSAVKLGMAAEISPQGDENRIVRGKVLRIGRVFGKRSVATDDAGDKQDVRTVECMLSVEDQEFLIGQRVLVRILPQ